MFFRIKFNLNIIQAAADETRSVDVGESSDMKTVFSRKVGFCSLDLRNQMRTLIQHVIPECSA
jgi:hypothetical protein